MANKNSFQSMLSKDQIHTLFQYILDTNGTSLSEDELMEIISLVQEDVPGIEMESSQFFHSVITQIKELYYGNSNKET